jgi:TorA maturation chaperone TorD
MGDLNLPQGSLHEAAEDLRTLAWLHRAERTAATWLALHEAGFPGGLTLQGPDAHSRTMLTAALVELRAQHARNPQAADDELAADYADIYLTHTLHASPYESVWRDEDHLMLQGPTFAVREFYRRHGMVVSDWRQMPDDHLSHELDFVAHLLAPGPAQDLAAAQAFLKNHLMTWLPDFAARVSRRARTPLYAALAALTAEALTCLGQEISAVATAPLLG